MTGLSALRVRRHESSGDGYAPWRRLNAAFVLVICLVLEGLGGLSAATVPAGFTDTVIPGPSGGSWNEAVGITFDITGRMFVWERGGRVWFKDPGDASFTKLLDISAEVGEYGDHGCLGFALDPAFRTNGYMYILYNVEREYLLYYGTTNYNSATKLDEQATIGRLTRYTCQASNVFRTVDPASRLILIGETKETGFPSVSHSHGVGSVVFGEDGTLLVSCGSGGTAWAADTGGAQTLSFAPQGLADGIIRPKEDVGDFRSQLVDCLNGKVVRIDPATGNGIPSNPYYDAANPRSPHSRVWALGLRQPFRMALRPNSGSQNAADGKPGVLYIGDVGWNTYESLRVVSGPKQNSGWPTYEGFYITPAYNGASFDVDIANQDAPNPLYPASGCSRYFSFRQLLHEDTLAAAGQPPFANPCNAATNIPSSIQQFLHHRPVLDWIHGSTTTETPIYGSSGQAQKVDVGAPGSPVSGAQFPGVCAVGGTWYTGTAFPTQYRNTYFFADWGQGLIENLTCDQNDKPLNLANFASSAGTVVCVVQHPLDGSLYYVTYTYGSAGSVQQIAYTGNGKPTAAASADKYYGPAPLTVQLSSSGSSDPNGLSLTYSWNFGDGSALSTQANPSHTFSATNGVPTEFVVTLTVTNSAGLSAQASLSVIANGPPPAAGLVAAYAFNEGSGTTVADASGNGNNGTINGATWTTGKFGQALSFNGSGARVTVKDAASLDLTNAMTLEAWVYPTAVGGWRDVIYKETNDIYYLMGSSQNGSLPAVGGTFATTAAFGTTSLPLNTWSHLAGTYDGAMLRLYVNGVPVGSQAQTGAIHTSTGVLSIGGDGLYGQYWAGLIDEVRIYNLALSQAQIQSDMTTPVGGASDTTPPTVPEAVTASAVSSSEIIVNWIASTDNVGVTGYLVERSQGAGSTAFVYVGTVSGTNYYDTGLLAGTPYTYRVRATDAAGNLSDYSGFDSDTTLPASAGLVAAYAFNEGSGTTVADASGNGNNGTINGATWTTGKFGQALLFNGSSALVTVNDAASLDLTNGMTLEAWVYPTAVSGWQDVIYKETNDIYYLMGSSMPANKPAVGGTFATTAAFGTTGLPLNTWSHLAGTYDGAMMRLYVNGVPVGSQAQTGAIHTSTGPLTIGGGIYYANQYWAGRIDEVRIYNRALSQAEITNDMNTAIGNTALVLTVPPDQTIHATTLLATNATATDSDLPAPTLTFALVSGPAGLTVSTNGLITWTPTDALANTTNAVTVSVADNGSPSLSDTNSFNVIVVSRPIIQSISLASGNTTLTWSAIAGKSYRVQYKLDLNLTNWSDLAGDVTAVGTNAMKVDTTVSGTTKRFYRVQVLP